MSTKGDGGPAFPCGEHGTVLGGMTLRDYFIAHAPSSPQPWFSPSMPDCPELPRRYAELSQPQREQLEGLGDWLEEADCDPVVVDFARRYKEAAKAQEEWGKSLEKERLMQWPLAWADEMISRRKA